MFHRREFLARALKGSSLLAAASVVPEFVVNTARAAEVGKDTVLVLVELNGGNDGLNTVIPHGDDTYHKARPTLHFTKSQVVRVNDQIGLHPAMRNFDRLQQQGQLAIVQGVGYPNPDHSHFESMDIWQLADPRRKRKDGWIGRSVTSLQKGGGVAAMHIGSRRLPVALTGGGGGVVSISSRQPFRLDLGTNDPAEKKARKKLMTDLAQTPTAPGEDLLSFVQRRQVETYTTFDRLEELLRNQRGQRNTFFSTDQRRFYDDKSLVERMQLVARLITSGFGTRVFYVMIDGFDTHSMQAESHKNLVGEVADAITFMFQTLQQSGHDKRVVAMTFSEFGRRVYENGSKGTDHGSGSCLFVAGPAVKGGLVGKHPSLTDLDSGDLRYHTDFRCVYATLLDRWLGCDSKVVLDGTFQHLDLIKAKV
ncbi:MAG: DUF1501 domain-containing protein [Planctomycetes bacterium]|nr:DUF1501 domain-containing protein [Planctomycetota bacterium]